MDRSSKLLLALFIVLILPISIGLMQRFYKGVPQRLKLRKFYANPSDSEMTKMIGDTAYHVLPPFSFIDQDGKTLTEKDFENKIFIADFIFTTCPGICPIMTHSMKRVQDVMEGKAENLMFLTHTVDPEEDTPEVLKAYGKEMGADFTKWKFATGPVEDIYNICAQGYKLSCKEGTEDSTEEFDHSGRLVLLDKDRVIRGYYMGTDTTAIKKLMKDILVLQMEYPTKKDVLYKVN